MGGKKKKKKKRPKICRTATDKELNTIAHLPTRFCVK
jgi:hypothetical protein